MCNLMLICPLGHIGMSNHEKKAMSLWFKLDESDLLYYFGYAPLFLLMVVSYIKLNHVAGHQAMA